QEVPFVTLGARSTGVPGAPPHEKRKPHPPSCARPPCRLATHTRAKLPQSSSPWPLVGREHPCLWEREMARSTLRCLHCAEAEPTALFEIVGPARVPLGRAEARERESFCWPLDNYRRQRKCQ